MKMSLNELTAALKRSFEGLGFDPGAYEDAAKMVIWLEASELDGLNEVRNALSDVSKMTSRSVKLLDENEKNAVVDGGDSSVLVCGPQAVDMAFYKASEAGFAQVELRNCHNQKLIIERLVNCAKRGVACAAYWRSDSGGVLEHVVSIAAGEEYPDYRCYTVGGSQQSDIQSLYLICSSDYELIEQNLNQELCPSPLEQSMVSAQQLAGNYADSIERGIEVDADLLPIFEKLTKNVLVESTEQSRSGAGD